MVRVHLRCCAVGDFIGDHVDAFVASNSLYTYQRIAPASLVHFIQADTHNNRILRAKVQSDDRHGGVCSANTAEIEVSGQVTAAL